MASVLPWIVRAAAAVLLALCMGTDARAHASLSSELLLEGRGDSVRAELTLPLDELRLAYERALPDDDLSMQAYVAAHVRPVAPDGRPWIVKVVALRWETERRPADVVATLELRPPAGAPSGEFTLTMDAIAHQVPNHLALVASREAQGAVPLMLGVLRFGQRTLAVRGLDPRPWSGFVSLFRLGVGHIAAGTDHLLFLLTLLLPAALRADGGRWREPVCARRAAVNLLRIVTAFTAGHTVTLVLGACGVAAPPERVVETGIALTILVSAAHAWSPIFPRREAWVAGLFGLVHGLAFAAPLRELHLSGARLAAGLLGFNLGIEAVQAALVLAAAPALVGLARTDYYRPTRMAAAAVAAVLAVAWAVQRAGGLALAGLV
jgi:hypothetical protein